MAALSVAGLEFWIGSDGELRWLPTKLGPILNFLLPPAGSFVSLAQHPESDHVDLTDSIGNEWLLRFNPDNFDETCTLEIVRAA